MFGEPFPFLDSDVYKWLEAAAGSSAELGCRHRREADEAIGLIVSAQRSDGYLNTFVQVLAPGTEYRDLAWGHELYCYGHLLQAAIAWHRALGDDRLLLVAERAVASAERELGPEGREAIEGHPEFEMALVELYRATGERRYLDFATVLIERRGHGLLGSGGSDRATGRTTSRSREAPSVVGHAVRQLYLDCGAVDVAVEQGDQALLDAVVRRWRDMVATRMYITGALGSRHRDEAFGDPFELPPDLAYAETCAAIASVMLAWRLLLATGDPECADVIERTLYNAVLPALSQDGTRFFYVNPLQRRTERAWAQPGQGERATWYACACCPPNLMRTIASFPQLVATQDPDGIQIQQFVDGDVEADLAGGRVSLSMTTEYPWDGRVEVTVHETPVEPWTLTLRVPGWADGATLRTPDGATTALSGRTASERRAWEAGDRMTLELPSEIRLVHPDHRVDAIRGSIAFERGPLVYAFETADLPPGTRWRMSPSGRPPRFERSRGPISAPASSAWRRRPRRPPTCRCRPSRTSPGATGTSRRCGSGSRPHRDERPRRAPRQGRRCEYGHPRCRVGHAVLRQRQRRRPFGRRHGHQAQRRALRGSAAGEHGRGRPRGRRRRRGVAPAIDRYADPSIPLPHLPGRRRHRAYPFAEAPRRGHRRVGRSPVSARPTPTTSAVRCR